jgi:hypothetical protein
MPNQETPSIKVWHIKQLLRYKAVVRSGVSSSPIRSEVFDGGKGRIFGGGARGVGGIVLVFVRREFVIVVGLNGIGDGFAPSIGAKGADVLMLGELDRLEHGLGEIGKGRSGFGLIAALGDGGEEAAEGGVEIASGKILTGKEIRDVATDFFGGGGFGGFRGVESAERGAAGRARRTAAATVGEGEGA